MKKNVLFLAVLFLNCILLAQENPYDYLPKNISYNPQIPEPKMVIGHEVGEWHVTHDKLYFYMLELARISNRAVWEEYGRSYENRPLGHLIISSPRNIENIENIRQKNLLLYDPQQSGKLELKSMPVIIKLGYGIHGNESSSQNASLLTAYYLTAGQGDEIDEILNNTVILIDPSLNPDGMQRHSAWVNATRSLNNNPDPDSWEFSEPWPGGRTNHYWFDLNRDYLLLQHPESVGRVKAYFNWRPAIVTDHHEMQAERSFFFQPGIPSRNNPLVPAGNMKLTAEIGSYHEKYLNEIRSLYYTEEDFDDYYVGKGSSYPDIHGSVGILFEQAGPKGHLREVPSGLLSLPFGIRNQFTVSLSSIEAGLKMREKLLDSQRRFHTEALAEASGYPVKAFVFTEPDDKSKTSVFIDILLKHQIRVFSLAKTITKENLEYRSENSYIIPLNQNEYRFIRSIFEPVKEFTDSTFYDVSTWVLPMSFNIPFAAISSEKEMSGLTGTEIISAPELKGKLIGPANSYAYLFEWNEYLAPKALYHLQNKGLVTRVGTKEFTCVENDFKKKFSYGTIMITSSQQPISGDELYMLMNKTAEEFGITIYSVSTGLTPVGADLGSGTFMVLKQPAILMLVGNGMSSSHTGEIWHLLDARFNIRVTNVTADRMGSINLNKYNVLILAGSPEINNSGIENIRNWNRQGGIIIGYGAGNNWLVRNKLAEIEFVPAVSPEKPEGRYIDSPIDRVVNQIPGAIFETRLDLTHPLCFGYTRSIMPVMKTGTSVAKKNTDIYNNPVIYTDSPLLSGYCTPANVDRIKGNAFVSVHGNKVVSFYDNTNFRAIWYGTNRVFLNAIFFGQVLR